ncbi:MAG: HEAT repeat domain-containing protein [Elusimicrobiales bacterium]|nr:HEAT repeat domain-containing protein [Elusimicrobiales bacterium]
MRKISTALVSLAATAAALSIAVPVFSQGVPASLLSETEKKNIVAEKIRAAGSEKALPAREKLYGELGDLRDASAVPVLRRAVLNDAEPGARISAVHALRKIGGVEALDGLTAAFESESHKGVRIQVVNALGFFGDPGTAARLLSTAAIDPDKDVRIAAVMALSRSGEAAALASGFDSEQDPDVRLAIIDSLSRAEGGERELEKIRGKSGDARVNKRLEMYLPAKRRGAAGKR